MSDSIVDGDKPDEVFECTFAVISSTTDSISTPCTWLLLDSQSTVSVFKNEHYMTNIRKSPTTVKKFTNGGTQVSNMVGDVKNH